jgi:hypothetical protein
MIVLVGHNDVAVSVHCDSEGEGELRDVSISVSMAHDPSPRQSGHNPLGCDLADAMVHRVSHKDVAVRVYYKPTGLIELSIGPFSVLKTLLATARQSGYDVLRYDNTFREHSGKVRGHPGKDREQSGPNVWEYSGNMRYRSPSDHAFREHSRKIREHSLNVWEHSGNMRYGCRSDNIHSGKIQERFRESNGTFRERLETFMEHDVRVLVR